MTTKSAVRRAIAMIVIIGFTLEGIGPPSPAQVSLRSAAVMSAILTFAALFTVFLPQWAVRTISAGVWDFLYALVVFLGGEFFAGLVAILGLAQYARK